jgi:gliding motility-associated protein GldM
LPVENGKAAYSASAGSIGTKKYKVKIEITNPLTGEVKSYDKEFEYEVGERSVTVSADKMNVFYIGVDNPISVSAAGISSNELKVSVSGGGGSITKVGSANFMVRVDQPTDDCRINVSGGGLSDSKVFRVKRIPDPTARLGNKEDGSMGNGEFKAQSGLIAWLDNFDFDAKCDIQGFKLVRVPKRQDPIEVLNSGGRYSSDASRIANQAKPGDTYYFFDVKARCPGDKAGRKINSLVFNIK